MQIINKINNIISKKGLEPNKEIWRNKIDMFLKKKNITFIEINKLLRKYYHRHSFLLEIIPNKKLTNHSVTNKITDNVDNKITNIKFNNDICTIKFYHFFNTENYKTYENAIIKSLRPFPIADKYIIDLTEHKGGNMLRQNLLVF